MPEKRQSEETIQTSPTIRRTGKYCGRLVINCLKLFYQCKKHKKASIDIKKVTHVQQKDKE